MTPTELLDRAAMQIVATAYPPGMHLTADRLAADLGTSRTPARECLRSLDALGLVEIHDRRGAFVIDPQTLPPCELIDLVQTRSLLEPFVMGQAADRHDRHDLALIDAALDAGDEAMGAGDVGELNIAHHRLLTATTAAAHNSAASRALLPLHYRTCPAVARTASITLPHGWPTHRRLRDLIAERDATTASDLHRHHLESVLTQLVDHAEGESA